jgi:hypothetical protein
VPDRGVSSEMGVTVSEPERNSRRRKLELSWIIGVVAFVIVRFAIAYSALNEYGLTVWIFGILDIVTAVPYAIGTARLVTNLVDKNVQVAARWGIVACISFLAPYAWVAWAGRDGEFPTAVYITIAVLVVCLGTNAIVGVLKRVRTAKVDELGSVDHAVGVH